MMAREKQHWKKLQRNDSGGGTAYIGARDLQQLEDEGVLDTDGTIEYSVTVGSSDGRARAFISLRNREEGGSDGE